MKNKLILIVLREEHAISLLKNVCRIEIFKTQNSIKSSEVSELLWTLDIKK